jgi:hypothetical protein
MNKMAAPGLPQAGVFVVGWLAAFVAIAPAGKAAPLDVGLTFSLNQNTLQNQGLAAATAQEINNAKNFGNSITFVVDWYEPNNLTLMQQDVDLAEQDGLQVTIQLASNNDLFGGVPGCTPPKTSFGDAATAQQYEQAVAIAAGLKPAYLNLYPEVNLLDVFLPSEYSYYQQIYPQAYDEAKAISPQTQVGASFLDSLWVNDNETALPNQLGPHDFIGITDYAYNQYATPADIPSNWYQQWRTAYPNEPLMFSELGWPTAAPSSDQEQVSYIQRLPSLMAGVDPVGIFWALTYDDDFTLGTLTPAEQACYEKAGTSADTLLTELNSIGLYDADGNPKPGLAAAKALSAVPEPSPVTIWLAASVIPVMAQFFRRLRRKSPARG